MKKIEGVIPALVTPLNADETLNVDVLRQLMGDLLNQGAEGFYIGGATGEGLALTRETREELAQQAISYVDGRKPCIVHIASMNNDEMIYLARHAERCGADAVSAIPPMFFGYSENDVLNYYKKLADAVSIPVMVYYSPAASFHISAEFAAKLFEIDNVTAIKWTSSDYYSMMKLRELTNGEMNIINGPDEMLLMGLSAGADGGIGSTYNVILPRIKSIWDCFKAGKISEAREAQTGVNAIISAMLGFGYIIPTLKVALEKQGYAVGNAAFPMKRYNSAERDIIWSELLKAGL